MKFIVYRDSKGEWRWHLKARNGRIVADSAEGYKRKGAAVQAVQRINAFAMARATVEVQDD